MASEIKCPKCGNQFPMEEAVAEEYKADLREQMQSYKKQKDEELLKRQDEFSRKEQEWQKHSREIESELVKKMEEEKIKLSASLHKNISADFENKLQLLEIANRENEEKLKSSRLKELEFLKREQELKTKEAELEIDLQKRLQEARQKLSEDLRKIEEQKTATRETEYQLRLKELEKQLEDQKKLAGEMKRKAEQGSMQLQGEVQELVLEELLRSAFPFDIISEIGKGVRGADCIQLVRNNLGQECGKIIYESKRAENFGADWIEKFKGDMRSQGADMGILVSRTMPKDMTGFGEKNGIWICNFEEVRRVAHVLRDAIIRVYSASKSHENKGDKMQLLYHYLTSNEFSEQWKAIREGFMSLRTSIQKERDLMEKIWKSREKQLEKVLLNAAHIKGSVEGIAGQDSIDMDLLTDQDDAKLIDN